MRSDLKAVWNLFVSILKLPLTLLLVLAGKKDVKDLGEPIHVVITYVVEAKVTMTIIMVNIIMFVWSRFWPEQWLTSFMDHPQHLLTGHVYTLFTATYLHANIGHLIGNMTILFFLGRMVEERLGAPKYFGLYTIVGIIASLINNLSMIATSSMNYTLGASGAIAGIMAAAMLYHPFRITFAGFMPLPTFIVVWMGIYGDATGILNPTGNIAYWAHMGGYLGTMFVLAITDKDDLKKGLMMNMLTLALVVITSVLVGSL